VLYALSLSRYAGFIDGMGIDIRYILNNVREEN
jgi:hypothetical protein